MTVEFIPTIGHVDTENWNDLFSIRNGRYVEIHFTKS